MDAQTVLNSSLKKELDSMFALDQKYRTALSANMTTKGDSLAALYGVKKEDLIEHLWRRQSEIDSFNTERVEEIIKAHGYPGSSLVGIPTNEAAFYIIQHSKVIEKYLQVIEEAATKKEIRFLLYAMMLDRSLMFADKEQIYGTQGTGFDVKNTETGRWERLSIIWPIKNPASVNERRKTAGFSETVEKDAKELGINYKVFKLDEVLKMRKQVIEANE